MVDKFGMVQRHSKEQTKAATSEGVLCIALAAGNPTFSQYKKGILDNKKCGTRIDHQVNIVGYGKEGSKEFYIIRNSWGPWWGDKGYIRILATDGVGICAVNNQQYWVDIK